MTKHLFLLAAFAACGYPKPEAPADAPGGSNTPDADVHTDAVVLAVPACNVLAQTGCDPGEKCTWITDFAAADTTIGHVGCAPDGTGAVGASCMMNPAGPTGYDDCAKGGYCVVKPGAASGTCRTICDAGTNAPCSGTDACITVGGAFANSNQAASAGVCFHSCNPIADNNFLGSAGNNKTGSACAAGEGCYGYPNAYSGAVTHWTCQTEYAPSRVHRTACDTVVHAGDTSACSPNGSFGYINGCAQGYEPLFLDAEGSTQVDCTAICAPGTCYNIGTGTTAGSANCGNTSSITTANLAGVAPHQCLSGDIQYASLNAASLGPSGNNGEQCYFSWLLEIDMNGNLVRSATSDTVGFCLDHSKFKYDPTGGSNFNTPFPKCDMIGLGPNGYAVQNGQDAVGFGCVNTATAMSVGELSKVSPQRHFPLVRMPYSRLARP